MRRRLAPLLALAITISLFPAAGAQSEVATSTEGIRILRLPDGDLGTAVAVNDSNWIATGTSVWRGIGYPIDLWPELRTMDPGGDSLSVVDLDSTGEVVGTYRSGSGFPSSFLWSDGSGMQPLGQRTATAIDGNIVGYTTGPSFIGRPGAFDSIPDPPVGGFVATGIRNGLVLGNGRTWDGAYVDLQENGVAYEMNSSGTIAGHIGDGAGGTEAAYWPSRSAAPIRLGFLGSDTMSQAWAINDDGWIVGWSGTSHSQADKRAFLWRPGSGMTDLGFFPGDSWAEAFDINNAGVIVGKSGYGPVIWDINGTFPMDYPPVVEPFGPLQVSAGQLLSETITISDYEGDPYTVEWTGLPSGAGWDGSALSWPTTLADEGSTYPVSLTVTQNSEALNAITVDTLITVGAPAPALAAIGNRTVEAGSPMTFTAAATPGTAGNDLFWSIDAPTASGASIEFGPSDSSLFSWSTAVTDVGVHTVTVTVTEGACAWDDFGCVNPTDSETFAITVSEPGAGFAPVLTPITETIDELQTLSIPRSDFLSDPDTPIDDITLTLEDGPDAVPPGALINGIFSWTPTEEQGPGTYEFTVRASDTSVPANETTASIRITVHEVNSAPIVHPVPPQVLSVGETLDFAIPASDGDIPENHLEYLTFTGPGFLDPFTGQYSFTASEVGTFEFSGGVTDSTAMTPFSFQIEVTDGTGNLPPDPQPDLYGTDEDVELIVASPGVLTNDRDPDGDSMLAVLVDPPAHGSVALDETGAFRYAPDPDFHGTDAFTYYATDGTPSPPVEVRITVDPVNDAPFIEPIDDIQLPEGLTVTIDPVYGDVDTIDLSHSWTGEIPPNAAINGIYVFTPTENQGGQVFTAAFAVTDGEGGSTEEQFTITVVETNQPPSLGVISDQQVFTGDGVFFDANATDPDLPAQTLTYSLEGAPSGAAIDPATGEFSWPGATTGTYIFDVVVKDDWVGPSGPAAAEDRWEVTILVIDPTNLPNDVALDLTVIDGDPDADGIVDLGTPITLRARITETNLGVSSVNVKVTIPGDATLVSSTADACERERFSINGNTITILKCDVGSVSTSEALDIVVTLDDTQVYDIIAEVTSSANPETNATNNSDGLTLEARIRVSITEMIGVADIVDVVPPLNLVTILEAIGVADLVDVVPPLDLATILESIAVGDGVDVIPPLTLSTILEAIGVTDTTGVVPPLDLATIIENIAVTDSGELVYDTDGSGIPDVTATAVDPLTGQPLSEAVPGTEVLITGSGLLPNSPATVVLFSDPVHLADIVTDGDGSFAVVVTIPPDTAAGEHRIIVTGEWQHGGPIEVIFPIDVLGLCTITGTDGLDILVGTSGDDIICGLGGNDLIFGGRGDDLIFGGAGNDLIFGSQGNDDLFGEEGDDVLFGGWGDDHLAGGPGADFLIGGPGDDTILQ
ncbi:MAG: tandem-95 repeat protein [Actinomycetota bacterium]|nr:tandem-95 repeat protein [Actinomycetota bacterium]